MVGGMSRKTELPAPPLPPTTLGEERRRIARLQGDRREEPRQGRPERRRWNRRALGAGLITLAGLAPVRGPMRPSGSTSSAATEPASSMTTPQPSAARPGDQGAGTSTASPAIPEVP